MGHNYQPMQGAEFTPTAGAADDYAFSRFQSPPLISPHNKVYAFTVEFGQNHFYPTQAEFQENVINTGAALMEFCLAAADFGLTGP
jgi:hypothetical protein